MIPSTYYKTCPSCGANLDPGEHCDCEPTIVAKANAEDMVD